MLGRVFVTVPCLVISVTSVKLSGFMLTGFVMIGLLGLSLPCVLMLYSRAAFVICAVQGAMHSATEAVILRVASYWVPDRENTFLMTLFSSGYLTGRMGVMFLSSPVAQRVHWSAPSVIFGSLLLVVICLLTAIVSATVLLCTILIKLHMIAFFKSMVIYQ